MNESKVAYRYKLFAIFVVKLSRLSYFTALHFTFKPLYPSKKKFEGSTSLLLPPGVENPS